MFFLPNPGITRRTMLLLAFTLLPASSRATDENPNHSDSLRVMTWNIWHGGREDGKTEGPQRVVEVIKSAQADIIAMQETYGSGPQITKGLGFHFQERGTNLSIHSRFPIVEDISVFEKFKCIGSLIQLPSGHQVAFYCIWLPYAKDIWLKGSREGLSVAELQAACQPSTNDLVKINDAIKKRLSAEKYQNVSLMIAGDFNSMSHLDYGESTTDEYGKVIDWTTSRVMTNRGFRDSYRETHPVIDRTVDATWSPRFPEQEQDRIDFIYYRSKLLRARSTKIIRKHPVKFPSDHAAVVCEFEARKDLTADQTSLNVVSYNIKRGYGNDGRTDLTRSAAVLKKLNPDFVGLQEIDFHARRSGDVNQVKELSRMLKMHGAFGPFMDFQGGKYGLAILSKHPIRSVYPLRLPTGNEPRVALIVEAVLPNDQTLMVVNVHFDWVRDDKFRFAQATTLKKYLQGLQQPYILLGDFNDRPGSRTVELLAKGMLPATKPKDNRFTIPATKPTSEIDYIFAQPPELWKIDKTKVIAEPVASDHLPVFSQMRLRR